jgi:hypothetical protein
MENERGFHNPRGQGHDHNRGGSSGSNVAERFGKKAKASEPTNHAGHTHEMARRHEHDARIDAIRAARNTHHHAAPGGSGPAQHQHKGSASTVANEEAHEA